MKIFALSDPHISLVTPKPMGVFGHEWENHWEKIQEHWTTTVGEEDVVLIPGDISWAMQLEDAKVDLDAISKLKGKKVIMRGNHDYWWSSLSKVNNILAGNMFAVQNNAIKFENVIIAGTRGWSSPGSQYFGDSDMKIYLRELARMKLSISAAEKLKTDGDALVLMLHYPPFNETRERNEMCEIITSSGADALVYGHLHSGSRKKAFSGMLDGVDVNFVSCDNIDFTPKLILDTKKAR